MGLGHFAPGDSPVSSFCTPVAPALEHICALREPLIGIRRHSRVSFRKPKRNGSPSTGVCTLGIPEWATPKLRVPCSQPTNQPTNPLEHFSRARLTFSVTLAHSRALAPDICPISTLRGKKICTPTFSSGIRTLSAVALRHSKVTSNQLSNKSNQANGKPTKLNQELYGNHFSHRPC